MKRPLTVFALVPFACAMAAAADWNQWRGPLRNGVVLKSPALADSWGESGPVKVWESEPISNNRQGYGSVAVAGGKVYLYVNWKYQVPVTLSSDVAKKHADTISPDVEVIGTDVVLCLDAADGKTLWRFEQKSRSDYSGGSSTPCVVDGRVYVLGSDADLYCLDAKTGSEIWQRKLGTGVKHTSVAVVDGTVIAAVGPLTALKAETGETLWEQEGVPNTEASPAIWRSGGHSYLLCNSKKDLSCVNLSDGSIAWTVPGGNSSSAAVSGDHMVVYTGPKGLGLAAYTLTPSAAEQIWAIERPNGESSPIIYEGHVYAVGGQQASCVDLSSGEIKWQVDVTTDMTSPVVADGKIISASVKSLTMFAATPEKYTLLGSANPPVGQCVSPAIADGKLYMRMGPGVLCYDLKVDPGESL